MVRGHFAWSACQHVVDLSGRSCDTITSCMPKVQRGVEKCRAYELHLVSIKLVSTTSRRT
jgi:hypothetical protein